MMYLVRKLPWGILTHVNPYVTFVMVERLGVYRKGVECDDQPENIVIY